MRKDRATVCSPGSASSTMESGKTSRRLPWKMAVLLTDVVGESRVYTSPLWPTSLLKAASALPAPLSEGGCGCDGVRCSILHSPILMPPTALNEREAALYDSHALYDAACGCVLRRSRAPA